MPRKKKSVRRKGAQVLTSRVATKKMRKSLLFMIYSLVAFIISFIFYDFITIPESSLQALFGILSILSLSLVILFAIIEIILYIIRIKRY